MKLISPVDLRSDPDAAVFRERVAPLLILSLVVVGIAGLWLWGAALVPLLIVRVPLVASALFFAWIAKIMLVGVSRGFGPGNWVLRVGPGGVALKLRSYLNDDLPASDPVVVLLRWEEIAVVGMARMGRMLPYEHMASRPEGASSYLERITYLDLHLVHEDTAPVREALEAERAAPRTGRFHAGHYPVQLAARDCLRVTWKSRKHWLRPGVEQALELMGRWTAVDPPLELGDEDWRALESEAFDDLVLRLVEEGEELRAVVLLRVRHGWSLTQAKTFVDELLGRASVRAAS